MRVKVLLTMNATGEDKYAYITVIFPFRHPSPAFIWIYNSVLFLFYLFFEFHWFVMEKKSRTQGSTILSSKSAQVQCLMVKTDACYN